MTSPASPHRRAIVEQLRGRLGISTAPADLDLQWREWRWIAVLLSHAAFIAPTDEAWLRLQREATIMDAARTTVGPQIPEVLLQDEHLRLHVRERMDGLHGPEIERRIFGVDPALVPPGSRYAADCSLTSWGAIFASDLGRVLARFHSSMKASQARSTGLEITSSPDWTKIDRVLHDHVGIELLRRALPQIRAWSEAIPLDDEVVVHGDPHFANMFADDDGQVTGLIDFDEAGIGNRHEDLRYLHSEGPRFARAALEAYEQEAGVPVDKNLVKRLHVRSASEHFSWVEPAAPRFSRIIEWASTALEALTPEWTK